MTPEEASGEIECLDDTLVYRSGLGNWSLPISSIRLVAEYTNSDGPFLDDYFFVFLTAPEDGWHQASFYAKGRDAALTTLGRKLGSTLQTGLCNSTEYRTRIMWPEKVRDQPLMDVIEPRNRTWWQKLTDSGSRDIVLSRVAREVFGG